jgi:plastocyanin
MNFLKTATVAALAMGAGLAFQAVAVQAEDTVTYELSFKDKAFSPAAIKVKAGQPFRIKLKNNGPMPVEIESHQLGFEKVAAGFSSIVLNVRAPKAGAYDFFDDFHPKEITGKIVAE